MRHTLLYIICMLPTLLWGQTPTASRTPDGTTLVATLVGAGISRQQDTYQQMRYNSSVERPKLGMRAWVLPVERCI